MNKAVFGLIGTGGIAHTQHLPNLKRSPHVFLKTVCDLDSAKLQRVREEFQVPESTPDVRQLLADPEIQAVVVATKEEAQAPLTIMALQAGKHVYVEKPLARSVEECETVVAAQKAAGKFVAVGFNRRFAPAYVKARELIRQDGGPRNIHYKITDARWLWPGLEPKAPGIRLLLEVCHIFDVIRWLTDSKVETVYCLESRVDEEIISLKMANGCVVSITSSSYMTMDNTKERLEVITNRGGLTVEEFVELRTYGYKFAEPVYRFAGHSRPGKEFTHKFLYEKLGAEALLAVRRNLWEMWDKVFAPANPDAEYPEKAEMETYMKQTSPDWNYMVDKGWFAAMDHFAQCVVTGRTPNNASAQDGLIANALSHAAMDSRDGKGIVHLPEAKAEGEK